MQMPFQESKPRRVDTATYTWMFLCYPSFLSKLQNDEPMETIENLQIKTSPIPGVYGKLTKTRDGYIPVEAQLAGLARLGYMFLASRTVGGISRWPSHENGGSRL